jgi:hypothetical protein
LSILKGDIASGLEGGRLYGEARTGLRWEIDQRELRGTRRGCLGRHRVASTEDQKGRYQVRGNSAFHERISRSAGRRRVAAL